MSIGALLNNVQRHHRMNLPSCVTRVGDFSGLIDLWERGPSRKNALPITATIGAWSIVSFRADLICSGKRNGAQTLFSRANLPMKLGL